MHLVPNSFDPQTSDPPLPVPWTNNPHKIDTPGETGPIKYSPWGSNWLGAVCPVGAVNWVPIVGGPNVGATGDHVHLGPNVSQPGLQLPPTSRFLYENDRRFSRDQLLLNLPNYICLFVYLFFYFLWGGAGGICPPQFRRPCKMMVSHGLIRK